MARMTGGRAGHMKTKTTTTTDANPRTGAGVRRSPRSGGLFAKQQHHVQHHQHRHATTGDKISGGLMKLKGDLTGRPGVKAAGTRRMHGTDGKGSHRVY